MSDREESQNPKNTGSHPASSLQAASSASTPPRTSTPAPRAQTIRPSMSSLNYESSSSQEGASKRRRMGDSNHSTQGQAIRPRPIQPADPQGSRLRPILPAPSYGVNQGYEQASGTRFAHGPTNLPPEPYRGQNPYITKPPQQNIHTTAATRLPRLEARINRLENAMEQYVDRRAGIALQNATLPGTQPPSTPSSKGSSRGTHDSPSP